MLFGLKTRWAAIALFGFCLLTALFFHTGADQAIELQKNVAMAGGFLTLAIFGPGPWSLDAWRVAPSSADDRVAESPRRRRAVRGVAGRHVGDQLISAMRQPYLAKRP